MSNEIPGFNRCAVSMIFFAWQGEGHDPKKNETRSHDTRDPCLRQRFRVGLFLRVDHKDNGSDGANLVFSVPKVKKPSVAQHNTTHNNTTQHNEFQHKGTHLKSDTPTTLLCASFLYWSAPEGTHSFHQVFLGHLNATPIYVPQNQNLKATREHEPTEQTSRPEILKDPKP